MKEKKAEQNQKALTDSLSIVKQKNGDLIYQKSTLVASSEELEALNKELYDEVKLLEEQKSKPKVVIKTKIVYVDRGKTENTVSKIGKNKYSLKFNYIDSDSIMGIKGRSEFKAFPVYKDSDSASFVLDIKPGETIFDTIQVRLGLTLGVKEDKDGTDRVFAKPDPNTDKIRIENIDAVQVEEFYKNKYKSKQKRFGAGPYIGVGLGTGNNGQIVIRPQIGVGVQWNLFKF